MEIFEGDDITKEDGSFLCNGEFGLNCGVASKILFVQIVDMSCAVPQVEIVWKAMIYLHLDR